MNLFMAARIARVESNKINAEGLKLQTKFTYENTAKQLLSLI